MPLLLESWIGLMILFAVGLGIGWLIWGRN